MSSEPKRSRRAHLLRAPRRSIGPAPEPERYPTPPLEGVGMDGYALRELVRSAPRPKRRRQYRPRLEQLLATLVQDAIDWVNSFSPRH